MKGFHSTLEVKRSQKLNAKFWVTELFLYDQFSDGLLPLIQQNFTAQSICGYTAIANSVRAAQLQHDGLNTDQIIQRLSDVSEVYALIDHSMKTISSMRATYISMNPYEFKQEKDKVNYMRDWVANYEISDFIQGLEPALKENIWFFRNCAYDHPLEMEKINREEAERVLEEKHFKGMKFFVEQFSPQRDLMTISEFKQLLQLKEKKENQIIILDLLGHYNIVLIGIAEGKCVISMCDTTKNDYFEKASFQELVRCIMN